MPTPNPPGLVGGGLGDETDPQPRPPKPGLVGGQPTPPLPPPGSVPPLEQPPNFATLVVPPDGAPVLTGFGLETHYKRFTGRSFSPYSGGPDDGPAVAPWCNHKPFMVKKVVCVAEAVGGKPPIPSSDTGDPNDWLLSEDVVLATPATMPAGDQLWRVALVYYYVMLGNPSTLTAYGSSSNPMSNVPAALNTLNVSDFKQMLGGLGGGTYNGVPINF
jgi:hypothetical protein